MGRTALWRQGTCLGGVAPPPRTLEVLSGLEGWVAGPHDNASYPAGAQRSLGPGAVLRKHFDLYANLRPAKAFPGTHPIAPDIDLVICRENTEGLYADRNTFQGGGEFMPTADVAVLHGIFTRPAIERISHTALSLARERRGLVSVVHKANVLKMTSGFFLDVFAQVAGDYPDVRTNDYHVDAMTAHLLRDSSRFDVIVTENMFGDILSDLSGELAGSLGVAPSLNTSDHQAMAQAVHGAAPDISGKDIANPTATILSAAMLLDWLGKRNDDLCAVEASAAVGAAVREVLRHGCSTPDLGGDASTTEFTQAVMEVLRTR